MEKAQKATMAGLQKSLKELANNTLKSTLHLASISSIHHNPDLKEYFYRKVAEGKPKMVVLNAVRNKLLRHV